MGFLLLQRTILTTVVALSTAISTVRILLGLFTSTASLRPLLVSAVLPTYFWTIPPHIGVVSDGEEKGEQDVRGLLQLPWLPHALLGN